MGCEKCSAGVWKYLLEQHIHLRAESPATGQRHSRPPSQVSLTRFCSTANTNLGQSPFQREMLKFSKRNAECWVETAIIFYFLQYSSNMSSGGPPAVSQAKARRYDRQLRCVDSLLRIELHHITLVFRLLIPNHRVFNLDIFFTLLLFLINNKSYISSTNV